MRCENFPLFTVMKFLVDLCGEVSFMQTTRRKRIGGCEGERMVKKRMLMDGVVREGVVREGVRGGVVRKWEWTSKQ